MKLYQCHKRVHAAKILAIGSIRLVSTDQQVPILSLEGEDGQLVVSQEYMDKHRPQVGGYFVLYPDMYQSYSPAKAFEEGYAEVVPHDRQPCTADAIAPAPAAHPQLTPGMASHE